MTLSGILSPGATAGRAVAAVRALGADVHDEGARALLRALESAAETGSLPLPPIPEVVLRVRALIDAPGMRMADLDREIQRDASLATRIVGIANSPFYGAAAPLSSVSEAVVRLGLRQTHHLVLAVVLRSRVLRAPGHEAEVGELWAHALATSLCAQSLAGVSGGDPEQAALLGLVHDAGRVAILAALAEVERSSRGHTRIAADLLAQVSLAVHPLLGAVLADAWSLPPMLGSAIAHHHEPRIAPELAQGLTRLLAAADRLARMAPGEDQAVEGFTSEQVGTALEEARESYAELGKLL